MALAGGLGTPVDVAQITDEVVPVPEHPPRAAPAAPRAGARRPARAGGGRGGRVPPRPPAGRVHGRRPVLRAVGLPHHVVAAGRARRPGWHRPRPVLGDARRLLPALFLLLAGVALFPIATATPAGERPTLRAEALATLGYAANWQAMADDVGYWDMFARPSPLDHMWSLAIEEQFYVVWPLLVVGLLVVGRRARLAGPGVVAAASAAGRWRRSWCWRAPTRPSTRAGLLRHRRPGGADSAGRRAGGRVGGTAPPRGGPARCTVRCGHAGGNPGRSAPEPATGASPGGGRGAGWAGPVAGWRAWPSWAGRSSPSTARGRCTTGVGWWRSPLAAVLVVHVVTSGRGGSLAGALSARPSSGSA